MRRSSRQLSDSGGGGGGGDDGAESRSGKLGELKLDVTTSTRSAGDADSGSPYFADGEVGQYLTTCSACCPASVDGQLNLCNLSTGQVVPIAARRTPRQKRQRVRRPPIILRTLKLDEPTLQPYEYPYTCIHVL